MKPKKLPRRIQAYSILLGLFFGQLVGAGTLAISLQLWKSWSLSFLAWLVVIVVIYGLWLSLCFKYKEDLAKWGLIEIDKPKKKKRIPTLEEMQKK